LKSYQEAAERFNVPVVDERFEFLRLLGNLFMLPHDAIKQYTEDNSLGRVDLGLLKPYLMQRGDWGTFSIAGIEGGSTVVGDSEVEGSGGIMERFGSGRLGAMVRELEGLKIGAEDLRGLSLPTMPSMPAMPSIPTRAFGLGATAAGK
jgi:hypothetical protein